MSTSFYRSRLRKFELCDLRSKSFATFRNGLGFQMQVYTLKLNEKIIIQEGSYDTCFRYVLREGKDEDLYHETYHDHEPETVKSLRESDYVNK